jgi:hypothetical protein
MNESSLLSSVASLQPSLFSVALREKGQPVVHRKMYAHKIRACLTQGRPHARILLSFLAYARSKDAARTQQEAGHDIRAGARKAAQSTGSFPGGWRDQDVAEKEWAHQDYAQREKLRSCEQGLVSRIASASEHLRDTRCTIRRAL